MYLHNLQFKSKTWYKDDLEPEEHQQSTSHGEKSSNIDDNTSSQRADVRRDAMRPIPFAADHRTTVS